ncbi:MAG: acyltransferase domain-containing protein [Candidatus Sumerlaeota bacterium]|nr:acyltransferase domain-containing protein [Candidatus Sumerlaeota bacterium]
MVPDSNAMVDLDTALASLGMSAGADYWRAHWADSQTALPSGAIFFLSSDCVRQSCRFLNIAPEIEIALLHAAQEIEASAPLRRIAWHCHWLLFRSSEDQSASIRYWPMPPRELGDATQLLYAIVFLSGLPFVQEIHRRRGIAENITIETLADLELWMREHRKRHGVWGLSENAWIARHFYGQLIRLGRLQFEPARFREDFYVFLHRTEGRVVILAGDGMQFRRDGLFSDADGAAGNEPDAQASEDDWWTAVYSENGEIIRGHAISPHGAALAAPIEIRTQECTCVLKKDDPTLAVHIPAIGPMSPEACAESFRRALEFFPKHYPDHPFHGFTCFSWLLDPQFQDYLSPSSNIVCFQRAAHLFPIPGATDRQMFDRVFEGPVYDLSQAPRDTALRRAILEHIERRGCWRMGGALWLANDWKPE